MLEDLVIPIRSEGGLIEVIVYIIGALIVAACLYGIVVSIKHRKWLAALACLFVLPWVLWFAVSTTVGGSTFHHAATDYSEFQEGHYYLVEHNRYMEVSCDLFQKVRFFEVAAWISFSVSAVFAIINVIVNRKNNGILSKKRGIIHQ